MIQTRFVQGSAVLIVQYMSGFVLDSEDKKNNNDISNHFNTMCQKFHRGKKVANLFALQGELSRKFSQRTYHKVNL